MMNAEASSSIGQRPVDDPVPKNIVSAYLKNHEPVFQELAELRASGWANPLADEYFKAQRLQCDNADKKGQRVMYEIMRHIGDEVQTATQVFSPLTPDQTDKVLDLCMAPGAYSACAFKHNPRATMRGITLPEEKGGHPLIIEAQGLHMDVRYIDITMLATEFGVTDIPPAHPESANFSKKLHFPWDTFDLVFCDGQVLRKHDRPEHREPHEATRLKVSQFIFALQHIKTGGSLVMLLHEADAWPSIQLIHQISGFTQVQLFKPRAAHRAKSSFYLIAKNVQPSCEMAKEAVKKWKKTWWRSTFGGENGTGEAKIFEEEVAMKILDKFREQLIALARPIWQNQAERLRNMNYAG